MRGVVLGARCWVLGAVLCAGCWVLGAAPLAQQRATAPQQAPTFQASTQVVQVDVRVFGKDGAFIEDLTIDDFEVLEDGKPQSLRTLFFVGTAARDSATAAPLVSVRSGVSGGSSQTMTTSGQTWIFVFDLNHLTTGSGFNRARDSVSTFLKERFRDGDLGGVVAGSRMVNNRLTSVRSELEAAAASVKPIADHRSRLLELTREWPKLRDENEALAVASDDRDALQRAVVRACSEDQTGCQNADMMLRDKARRFRTEMQRSSLETLNALQGLASGLARVPGPKTIVLLTDGLVTQGMEASLQAVVGQTTRAGARIYAIDARGMNRGASAGSIDQVSAEDAAGAPARFDIAEDAPNSLSVDTGGFFIRNQNNIGRALIEIADDANRYYVLGYQPEHLTLDGKFRPIEVRVKRSGVTVRARRGYLALPTSQLLVPQPVKRQP